MKRQIIMLGLCLLVATAASAQLARGGTLYVTAKSVALKSSTGFFASTRGTLNYGARVTVLTVSGKWVQVQSAANTSVSGWTASANLTAKQIVSGNTGAASAREIALAGKGFNQEVEDAYKAQGTLNYADVDRTEEQTVSMTELEMFLDEGRLKKGE
jgi:uncharacterized protein YgiM (DUF1202 family)